jgi:hypothetical protein
VVRPDFPAQRDQRREERTQATLYRPPNEI